MKLLKQKKSKLKRSADTKRKVEKGGVFEAFERKITGRQEDTNIRPDHGRHVWDALEKFDRK